MKIDLSEQDIKLILSILQKVDPTGMFLTNLGKNIIAQAQSQASEQVKPILPKEDADIISKLENDIKKEVFQPSSFQGTKD